MQYKKYYYKYIIRLDPGEEIITSLKEFCMREKIKLGSITGVGAVNQATLGLFDPADKKYYEKELHGNFELAPIAGNISSMQGEPYLHLHANLGDKEQRSFSGHLNKAIVSATCEIIVDTIEGELERQADPKIGLNLLEF
jgi:hypothetical protein